ncbi:MAG: OmpA family protein [Myxococcota bacterium]|nr:OmpA family protein [Myxococcota bacterium]MDW8362391.1 OmpA family protein [Myxococcales bacterium]
MMRRLLLTTCLVGLVPLAAPSASAQDDEFDDEFDEDEGGSGSDATAEEEALLEEDTEEGEPESEGGAADADAEAHRAERLRMGNSLDGPTGGLYVVDAAGGAVDAFRLQLATEFFFASDFLEPGDENERVGGVLSLSWTVADMVELFASLRSHANFNSQEEPKLFQVLGDTSLGVKVWFWPTPVLALGGDLVLSLLNRVGDIGLVLGSTSAGLRGNVTADLRRLQSPVPLVLRLNLQYELDNSAKLIEDVENARYAALPDPRLREYEDRHLVSRVERFALGVNRTDFFNVALGLEAPLRAAEDFYLHPMLEWTLAVPVNRQGYDCLYIPDPEMPEEPAAGQDGCLDRQGFSSFPSRITLGVRVQPPVRGLQGVVGLDVGVLGTSTFVRELAAMAPYNVMIGLSYAYDTRPPPVPEPQVREVVRTERVEVPPPPRGRLIGRVLEQGAETPVANATIRFPGRDLTALLSGDDGRFATYALEPGDVALEITHPEYNPATCSGTIPAQGGDVEVRCELVALPRVGHAEGRVTDEAGAAVAATVLITGTATRTAMSDASGRFAVRDLPPGPYTARVEADEFLIKQVQFVVNARQTASVDIALVRRPRRPTVTVRPREIQIRRQINFATDSDEILPDSHPLMEEIADVMIRNPNLRRIEIQGHTDNTGRPEHNMDLSQRRAESVRRWLIEHGVDGTRLEARGYGPTRPLVPNITPANRARNRRVQFVILERE